MADANVSQLEINGTTYDICDATARDSLSQYLPLTGGTLTGSLSAPTLSAEALNAYEPGGTGHVETNKLTLWANSSNDNYAGLYFKSYDGNNSLNRNEPFIRCYGSGGIIGDAVVIGNGGLTIIGGGESPQNLYDYYINEGTHVPDSEVLTLTSDNNMYFITGANTIANREVLRLTSAGALVHNDSTIDLTKSNNSITDTKSHSWSIIDKNGYYLAWVEGHAYTDGTTAMILKARNYGTGAAVSHGFNLGVANNGTRTVSFDDPSAWVTGLGLNPATVSVTASSGFGVGSVKAARVGRLVIINGGVSISASKAASTWFAMFTGVPAPSAAQRGSCLIWTNSAGNAGEIKVETDGKVYVWSPVAIGSSGEIDFSISYIAAS